MTERIIDKRAPFGALFGKTPEEAFGSLPTPCYILDEGQLKRNGEILARVENATGGRILLAQKAFSNYDLYPVLAEYLSGTEASGLFEARLGKEKMPGGEVHVFCGAYREEEFSELLRYADHIVFNSVRQLEKFGPRAKAAGKSLGLRINPECSTQEGHEIYDPCAPGSRLGVTREQWNQQMRPELLTLLDGLHFHTLCEQDSDDLEKTLRAVEEKFGDILPGMKWLNMGGGHHITRPGYDIGLLEKCIIYARDTWKLQVYLEPGEACALNAGFLASRVLDVTENGGVKNAILDTSAACHMPDVLEMPYHPPLWGEQDPEKAPFSYRMGGPTCLSGDVIGDFGFDRPLSEGDLLVFGDMAIYTTCKNNTFNGMPLPAIFLRRQDGTCRCLREFGYEDFRSRLGKKESL